LLDHADEASDNDASPAQHEAGHAGTDAVSRRSEISAANSNANAVRFSAAMAILSASPHALSRRAAIFILGDAIDCAQTVPGALVARFGSVLPFIEAGCRDESHAEIRQVPLRVGWNEQSLIATINSFDSGSCQASCYFQTRLRNMPWIVSDQVSTMFQEHFAQPL
jgi:hypothetical protein